MAQTPTLMHREAMSAPDVAAGQLTANRAIIAAAAARLRALDPPLAITIARGSSDHAAAFARHLFETRLRLPTLSQSPSVATLYRATSPRLKGALALAISQSGRSPDLVETAIAAREAGALLIAIVNDEASPLAAEADILVPMRAGREESVAATKTYIAALVAIADLTAQWGRDAGLSNPLSNIGATLSAAARADWSEALGWLTDIDRMMVLGRGSTAPIAAEAALKLKETSQIHAEAFSSAEVAHGPMAVIGEGQPVLAFTPRDAAAAGFSERLVHLAEKGARIIATDAPDCGRHAGVNLPLGNSGDPAIDAIAMIQSFYPLAEQLARRRELDPDNPPHLAKITRTR